VGLADIVDNDFVLCGCYCDVTHMTKKKEALKTQRGDVEVALKPAQIACHVQETHQIHNYKFIWHNYAAQLQLPSAIVAHTRHRFNCIWQTGATSGRNPG